MSLRRQLAVVALVYVIEGFPLAAYSSVFGFYFASQHVGLAGSHASARNAPAITTSAPAIHCWRVP